MNKNTRTRWLDSSSNNRKSKTCGERGRTIQKRPRGRKWLGRLVMAFLLVVAAAVAEAQQPKKVHPMGYLSPLSPSSDSFRSEGIRLALRQRNYIEGQNIAIEFRYAEGKRDRLPELAAELVRRKVDVILVRGGGNKRSERP